MNRHDLHEAKGFGNVHISGGFAVEVFVVVLKFFSDCEADLAFPIAKDGIDPLLGCTTPKSEKEQAEH